MRALLATLLVCAPLLAALPAAHAQSMPAPTLSLDLQDPAMALPPGEQAELKLYGVYRLPAGSMGDPDPGVVERGNGSRPTRVTFSVVRFPSWATDVTIDPPEVMLDPKLGYQTGTNGRNEIPFGPILVRVNVSPDAPALQREEIVVEGVAHENGGIPEARKESPAIKLRAAEIARANVTGPEGPILLAGGRWNVVTYTVTNEGNNDTTVLLNVTLRPENSEVEFPAEIPLAVGESAQVDVRIRTPWTEHQRGSLELEAKPLLRDDVGPASTYSVDVRGMSAVPGPGVAPLLGIGLVLAFLARRRA